MKELNLEEHEKYKQLFVVNGFLLMLTFFLSRIVFLGVMTFAYLLPTVFSYDYESARRDVGIVKVVWAQLLMILFFGLYFLNMFWFYKLYQGYKKYKLA